MTRKQLMKKAVVSGVFSLLVLAVVVASTFGWFISAGTSSVGDIYSSIEANYFSAEVTVQGERSSRSITLTSDEAIEINQDSFYLTDFVYDTGVSPQEKIFSWAPGYSGFTLLAVENNGTAPIRLMVTLEDITFKTDDDDYLYHMFEEFGFELSKAEYIECYKNLSAAGVTPPIIFRDTNGNRLIDGGEVFSDGILEDGSSGGIVNGQYDVGERYVDANGNGMFDYGEVYIDANGNRAYATYQTETLLRNRYADAVSALRSAANFNESTWRTSWKRNNRVFSKEFVSGSTPGEGNIALYASDNPGAPSQGSAGEIINAEVIADMRLEPGQNSGIVPITFWWPYETGSTGWSYDALDEKFLKGMMETYTDVNGNGEYDEGVDEFVDLNGNGKYDGDIGELVFTIKVSMQQVAPE